MSRGSQRKSAESWRKGGEVAHQKLLSKDKEAQTDKAPFGRRAHRVADRILHLVDVMTYTKEDGAVPATEVEGVIGISVIFLAAPGQRTTSRGARVL